MTDRLREIVFREMRGDGGPVCALPERFRPHALPRRVQGERWPALAYERLSQRVEGVQPQQPQAFALQPYPFLVQAR
jgi:hypothetical protein